MKKILLIQLPPPVEQALTEQLSALGGMEILSFREKPKTFAAPPDLIVTGGSVVLPGCPVLPLPAGKPQRLGTILRQIGQMLAQPSLYIEDVALGAAVFKPQERLLVQGNGEEISLTDREVDILAYLARHPGRAVSRDELLKNVWQYQEGLDTHTLETHIYRLRQKMEERADEPQILKTVEGGYALHL